MTDTVLVTGISGFLGGHIALQLLKAGYKVRGSVRNLDKTSKVKQTLEHHGADISGLQFVELDLLSDSGWAEAAKDVDYLVHVASPFVLAMPRDKMELIRPAVEGTERAINAALAANVKRIVLTSSFAAIGYGHAPSRPGRFSEKDWTNLNSKDLSAYIESKTLAEQRAWEMVREAGRENDLAVINPTGIFGPLLDEDPGTSAAIVQSMMSGAYPAAPHMEVHGVDVRDVAELHVKAMTSPEAGGNRFLASAGDPTIMDMAKVLAERFPDYKGKLPRFELPRWVVWIVALFDRNIRGTLSEVGKHKRLDNSKATALLGRDLISAEDAIIATAHSLIELEMV